MQLKYTYLILALFLILGCKKDKVQMFQHGLESNCSNLVLENKNICFFGEFNSDPCDYTARVDSINIYSPCFNPSNSNQIAFFKTSGSYQGQNYVICCPKLIIADINTQQILHEVDLVIPGISISWGDDVIVFNSEDGNIYKINADGSDLNLLIYNGTAPVWNNSNTQFIYTKNSATKPYLSDISGALIDSFDFDVNFTLNDWSASNKILYDFNCFDNNIAQSTNIIPTPTDGLNIYRKKWGVNNNQIIIAKNGIGIGMFEISTGTFNLIKANCSNLFYSQFDVSEDKQSIIAVAYIFDDLGEGNLLYRTQLKLLNINGTNEKDISFSW